MPTHRRHAMLFGAETGADGTRFRLWAPAARSVDLAIESEPRRAPVAMTWLEGGWFELHLADIGAGARYRFVIDGEMRVPDPASRAQPDGVHSASAVIDPKAFDWPDAAWRGRSWEDTVLYELHVGAFTPEGSFAGVAEKLDDLAALGITAIELMPVAEAPGRRNWGYDGSYPFAPMHHYGSPDDLKRLVAAAHQRSIMVFLDVVYNHFGPEGNYLHRYAPQFFTDRHATPWGQAIDFTRGPVRDFFIDNALYWLEEFHCDGLRFDAVHAIRDESEAHFLTELAERVRARIGTERRIHLVLENDDNTARYLTRRPEGTPHWYTAQWNDDIHHACHVLATDENEGYYRDYADAPMRHLGRALTEGFAYQGEPSAHRGGARRGEPSANLPPTAFVSFLQNHDQIGNRAFGERIGTLAPAEAVRALSAILLLAPSPPLLFMGEEWNAPEPFLFFCDFGPDLADAVRDGRRREFAHYAAFRDAAARARIPDPNAEATFRSAVLNWRECGTPAGQAWRAHYRELLSVRRGEIVPRLAGVGGHAGGFSLHGPRGLLAWWQLGGDAHLRLAANLGADALASPPALSPERVVFSTHAESTTDEWPGWFVRWSLESAAGHGTGA